jgi:hypothetical protein
MDSRTVDSGFFCVVNVVSLVVTVVPINDDAADSKVVADRATVGAVYLIQ